ncbi:MAG TPA: TonB family protein [Thermoanaerobaculia bacterium]|nr:TonB family protein [Thermoanaerobaculia bacterium]
MAAKNKPYEQFGPYILFKKLETDSLGELWRAARIEERQLSALIALRRLTGGNREALSAAAASVQEIIPLLTGTTFTKNQIAGVQNGIPFIAHDYAGGRSLRHIVDRARGGNGLTPNPIPIDQALVIAEKVALSLETTSNIKHQGTRLAHGALIPQLVWISDDGEIRVAGQNLGKGLAASLKEPAAGSELARYFAPEIRESGEATKASEVYALGATLYLLVTGAEPPDAVTASAFAMAVRGAKTTAGTAMPDDIRAILDKSLVLDPAARFASVTDMKVALSTLVHGGKYTATTFNLAFYLNNLLKKEMEGEALDRDRESKVNLAPYLDAPPAEAPAPAARAPFGTTEEPPKKKSMLVVAVVAVLAIAAIAAYFVFGRSGSKGTKPLTPATASAPAPPAKPKIEPILASPVIATSTSGNATATGTGDQDAQKKAFEAAVNQKLQDEMMKLQAAYNKELQKQGTKNAPPATAPGSAAAPAPQPKVEERAPSAAAFDAQRRDTAPAPAPQPVAAAPAPVPQPAAVPVAAAPSPAQAPTVREGDLVEITDVDQVPRPQTPIKPIYPPLAARQRVEGSVIVSALVSETGAVIDVRVLRGVGRLGLDEAAVRAMKGARFTPAIKDGKRVRTWLPQTIIFKP